MNQNITWQISFKFCSTKKIDSKGTFGYLLCNFSPSLSLLSHETKLSIATASSSHPFLRIRWVKSMQRSLGMGPLCFTGFPSKVLLSCERSLHRVQKNSRKSISRVRTYTRIRLYSIFRKQYTEKVPKKLATEKDWPQKLMCTLRSINKSQAFPLWMYRTANLMISRGIYVTRLYSQMTPAHPHPTPLILANPQTA